MNIDEHEVQIIGSLFDYFSFYYTFDYRFLLYPTSRYRTSKKYSPKDPLSISPR